MKVLGIAGSPRRGGNTDLLLGEVMRGAASRGAEVKTIVLNALKITPCQHCDGCLETGRHYGQGNTYLNSRRWATGGRGRDYLFPLVAEGLPICLSRRWLQ